MNEQPSNSKKYLLSIGIILLIVGIILFVYSFTFFGAFGRSNSFEEASANSMTWFGFAAIGGLLLFLGVALIYFSQIRRVSSYIATETSPAITTATQAVGKGVASGIKEAGGISMNVATTQTVKVKCRNCGYLESEDAEFCSKCGKEL